jgi:hypothetical protein
VSPTSSVEENSSVLSVSGLNPGLGGMSRPVGTL